MASPTGSAAFNEEFRQLTLLSCPRIALPATLMMLVILNHICWTALDIAGLSVEELLV